jgi:hypothetical protein
MRDTKRTLAHSGCSLLMVTGGLALVLVPIALLNDGLTEGMLLLAGALLAMAGGWMALRGIMPYMSVAGGALLLVGALFFIPFTGFGLIIFVLAGLLMVIVSLALIILGYKDLMRREEARSRLAGSR